MKRDPSPVAILAARLQRAYPALSPYSAAALAEDLTRIERAQRRHAKRCCSGEDGGYVKRVRNGWGGSKPQVTAEHDPIAEERARRRITATGCQWLSRLAQLVAQDRPYVVSWPSLTVHYGQGSTCRDTVTAIELEGDPRGAVLKIRLPFEAEAVSV
jgi:hypothetical protein